MRKLIFQLFEVDWLSLKLARPNEGSDITGCITVMTRWKFRVIMGEETSVRSPPKYIFRASRSCEAVNNNSLGTEEVES